jgi:RNA polymerase sigma factor (sigma-70 family)
MKTDSSLTKTEFDELLLWLDADTHRAAHQYERIRNRLIWFYLNRQCSMAEDLADETINRVAKKPKEWKEKYEGDPMAYFHAVAKNVFREYCRDLNRKIEPPPDTSRPELEGHLTCLKECIAKLTSESRNLILPYYQKRKKAKIDCHKEMGDKMGLKPGALRARIFRIRTKLRKCVEECLGNLQESNDINSADI